MLGIEEKIMKLNSKIAILLTVVAVACGRNNKTSTETKEVRMTGDINKDLALVEAHAQKPVVDKNGKMGVITMEPGMLRGIVETYLKENLKNDAKKPAEIEEMATNTAKRFDSKPLEFVVFADSILFATKDPSGPQLDLKTHFNQVIKYANSMIEKSKLDDAGKETDMKARAVQLLAKDKEIYAKERKDALAEAVKEANRSLGDKPLDKKGEAALATEKTAELTEAVRKKFLNDVGN
jgi:hypothetical protein